MSKLSKKFLKEGDIVECNNGFLYRYSRYVGSSELRLLGTNSWLDINSYEEDLQLKIFYEDSIARDFCIINIYKPRHKVNYISNSSITLSGYPSLRFLIHTPLYIPFSEWILKNDCFINLKYYV